jgi:pimeloyl-ACP methyl ester carboxylesterase
VSHVPNHRVPGPAGEIAVTDHGGDGPDAVLCHGANRTLLDWEKLLPHLTGLRLVSYDLRGHGRSDAPPDGDYGWDAHLADLDAVCEALALDDPRVIGHSLGGVIALCHGRRRPDGPGVVDLDGFGGGRPELYPGLDPETVAERRAEQLAVYSAALEPEILDAGQADLVLERARRAAAAHGLDAELEEAGARRSLRPLEDGRLLRRPGASAQKELMRPLEGWDTFTAVRETSCPVLLVQGGQGPQLSGLPAPFRELNEALAEGVRRGLASLREEGRPGLRITTVPEAGHMLHLQAPGEVGRLVRDFLVP